MLKVFLVIAVLVIIGLGSVLAYAATKPDAFAVQRTATINAPADRIMPLIDDLRAMGRWNPFEKDPEAKRTLSGAERGKGATYTWDGNREMGAGRIQITDATATRVAMTLDMSRPFEAHNVVEFTLTPNGSGTNVTWQMKGEQPYLGKVMSTFIDCDKMVGSSFEQGLAKLKAIAEQ
ncbi:MAG TPA: SRPBCC family protein [Pseudolabrys sp.]|nr:SRPBCC family protein [Pseudolabrys sp.]